MSMGVRSDGPISHQPFLDELPDDLVLSPEQRRQLKLLLRALCLIAKDLPLPAAFLDSIARLRDSWIADRKKEKNYSEQEENVDGPDGALDSEEERGALLANFESSLEHSKYVSSAQLRRADEMRFFGRLKRRIKELGNVPSEEIQPNLKIELNTLKLLGLQRKVRFEVATEVRLKQTCNRVESHLVDWGLMRLRYHLSSFLGGYTGSAYSGSDEQMRKKREDERQRRLEQAEQDRILTRKRKFFSELFNFGREFGLQGQQTVKLQKQRNDGIINWHAKQKQRATRAEKLRYQALKADDQEAYMRMVEESKNERLTTLLSKTDDLLQRLGAMVQEQKDANPDDAFNRRDRHKDRPRDIPKDALPSKQDAAEADADTKKRDYLEGQRQYNSAVHQIEEQVTEQPAMLEGGGQLRVYQLEGLQWMLSLYNNNLNGILADEMGLGKTIQTIALFAYLIENKNVAGPHIIVAPKAVLPNWAHEFNTWLPSVTVVMYDGRADERRILREQYASEGSFNVLVTHYDLIMRDKQFLKKIRWHYMVIDEGHRLKNHDCILAQTLASSYHIRRRLLLTGTPIQNSLQELWSLLNFILPAIFNSSGNFEEWFNAPFADRTEVSLTEEEQLLVIRRLHQVLRPFLLRRKKSEVEKYLPSKTQVMLKCDLSAWQKLYYQQMIESNRVGLLTGGKKQMAMMNTAMQLRKCCNHPYLFLNNEYDPRDSDEIVRASGKFELLDRLLPKLKKTGHRVLLFSQMTRLMDILEMYLTMRGYAYLRLDGNTKTEDRGKKLQQFNAEDSPYFMFLLSTRAGGLGLNLQTADTVIMFDSDWNPQMDQQAEDRAHRIGQKKEVHVFVLVSVGSIEEEILERAKSKMGIDAKVIQAGLFNTTSTAQERRELLVEIMRKGTSALSADVPSEREINRLTASSEEEFELFEEMDEERRKDEGYRSRLMEEHEVPEWVFLKPDDSAAKNDMTPLEGKRKRKEVLYNDVLSDSQWLKAVEDGQDVTALSKRTRSSLKESASATPQGNNSNSRRGSASASASASNSNKGRIVLKVRTRYRETVTRTRQSSAKQDKEKDSESEAPSSSAEEKAESSQQSQDWRKLKRKRTRQPQPESEEEEEEEEEQEEEEQQGGGDGEDDEANPSESDGSYEKKFQQDTGRSTRKKRKH